MTLIVQENTKERLAEVRAFAASVGASDELENALEYLDKYGGWADLDPPDPEMFRVRLGYDFAPHSFSFCIDRRQDDLTPAQAEGGPHYTTWFSGGLIYSGPGAPSNGSSPSMTVSLDDDAAAGRGHKWLCHT